METSLQQVLNRAVGNTWTNHERIVIMQDLLKREILAMLPLKLHVPVMNRINMLEERQRLIDCKAVCEACDGKGGVYTPSVMFIRSKWRHEKASWLQNERGPRYTTCRANGIRIKE